MRFPDHFTNYHAHISNFSSLRTSRRMIYYHNSVFAPGGSRLSATRRFWAKGRREESTPPYTRTRQCCRSVLARGFARDRSGMLFQGRVDICDLQHASLKHGSHIPGYFICVHNPDRETTPFCKYSWICFVFLGASLEVYVETTASIVSGNWARGVVIVLGDRWCATDPNGCMN